MDIPEFDKRLVEILAVELVDTSKTPDFEAWRVMDKTERGVWRNRAKSILTVMQLSGVRVSVSSTAKVDKRIEEIVTRPAQRVIEPGT